MIDRETIVNYAHIYRNVLSALLKPNVGIDMRIFPFNVGAIFIVKVGFEMLNKEEVHSGSESVQIAQEKAGLQGVDLSSIPSETSYFFKKNKIAIVKSEESGWGEKDAKADVRLLLLRIRSDS